MSAPSPSLAAWLATATGQLSPPAQERIKQELEAHFEDAVEPYRAAGLTEEQARARALADLGDATAAAKRFRRSHLTAKEAKVLAGVWISARWYCSRLPLAMEAKELESAWGSARHWGRRFWRLSYIYGCFLFLANYRYHLLQKHHAPLVLPEVSAIMLFAFQPISFWVASRDEARSSLRLLLTLEVVMCLNLDIESVYYAAWVDWGMLLTTPLFFSYFLIPRLRLWLKLRKMGDFSQELPPPGATAA